MLDLGVPPPTYRLVDTTVLHGGTRADDSADVWTARRASPQDPFDAPALVSEVSTSSFDTSPAVTLDGLTLYFGSDRSGERARSMSGVASRADRTVPWPGIQNVAALNSSSNDIPRPPGQHGLVMPLGSERVDSAGGYQTFLAARPAGDQAFATPVLVPGLAAADAAVADGFLTDDGLTLLYLRISADQGACSGATWARIPENLGT